MIDPAAKIHEHMEVVGSDGRHVGAKGGARDGGGGGALGGGVRGSEPE